MRGTLEFTGVEKCTASSLTILVDKLEFKNRDVYTVDSTGLVEDRIQSLELRLELHQRNIPKLLRKRFGFKTPTKKPDQPLFMMKSSTGLECPVCLGCTLAMYQTVRQFAYARKDMLQEYLKTCKFVYFRKVVSVIYLIPVQNFYLLFRNTCCTKMNVIKYFFTAVLELNFSLYIGHLTMMAINGTSISRRNHLGRATCYYILLTSREYYLCNLLEIKRRICLYYIALYYKNNRVIPLS